MADGTQSKQVATVEQSPRASVPAVRVVHDATAVFDSGKFEHMQRVARLMAVAPVVPDHLKGENPDEALGNCFAIVEQSHRWGMSPFAVAQATYFVHGKPGYEGKLIAAALHNTTGIKLRHEFSGPVGKPQRAIRLWDPDDPEREISGTVEQWATKNDMRKTQPDDQLIYRGTRQWCRRYESGVILGVYTPDELEAAIDLPPERVKQMSGTPHEIDYRCRKCSSIVPRTGPSEMQACGCGAVQVDRGTMLTRVLWPGGPFEDAVEVIGGAEAGR